MSQNTILLDHGSGGLASQELISNLFLKYLDNPILHGLEDSAVLENQEGKTGPLIGKSLKRSWHECGFSEKGRALPGTD